MKIYAKFGDVSYIVEYDKCNFVCGIAGLIANCEGKTYGLVNGFTGENKMKNAQDVGKLSFNLCSKARKIDADIEIGNINRTSEGIPMMTVVNGL